MLRQKEMKSLLKENLKRVSFQIIVMVSLII